MERGSSFRERVVVPWRYTWQLPDGERGRQAEGPGSCLVSPPQARGTQLTARVPKVWPVPCAVCFQNAVLGCVTMRCLVGHARCWVDFRFCAGFGMS